MKIDELITKHDLELFEQRINSLLKSSQNRSKPSKYLRTNDVCEMLGISPSTLQNMRNKGDIPFTKLGGTIYYNLEDIERKLNF